MRYTEAALLSALRERHSIPGNGGAGRYAFLTHVRTGAASDQQEIDAVAVALWPSEHHELHAFEVKCSRTDWLREIKPSTWKSDRTRLIADRFSIVAPKGIVREGELPKGWGLLEASTVDGETIRLRMVVRPSRLHGLVSDAFGRGLVVAMLRAAGAVPGMQSGLKRGAVAS